MSRRRLSSTRRSSRANSKLRNTSPVHDLYFEPTYEEFKLRTIWSLSNAFTSAFKELHPIPQFKATTKLGEFLEAQFPGHSRHQRWHRGCDDRTGEPEERVHRGREGSNSTNDPYPCGLV